MKKIKILDTTLRDGSYSTNFSFTSDTTSIICNKLEQTGFEFIEIGHGVGLNARNLGYGRTVQTDEEYMIAAKSVLKKAKYGMFCIPGVAKISDLDLAIKHDMGFIRIGTDVTKVKQSEKFIKKAKDAGMFVTANYMKSYALKPNKFAEQVKISEKYGADVVYVVDSAGGMLPDDIINYFKAIRKVSDIAVGFHAHDNLGLAISNTLTAIELGVDLVDSSLQGLGRSSGNACTEVLVMALKKKGIDLGIDYLKLLEVGQKYVQPLITTRGRMPLDIVAGYADFHSSYMPHILECASKHNIDPASLIIEFTKIDKVNMNNEILEKIAKRIKRKRPDYVTKYRPKMYVGKEQDERNNN